MKLGIISDIHGNFIALENVLAELERARVDRIVCLGDAIFNGSQPRLVSDRMKSLACPIVMGNADAFLLDHDSFKPWSERGQILLDIAVWTLNQLSAKDLDFIKTFQPRIEIPLDAEMTLLCYHGSPLSNEHVLISTTNDDEIAKMFGEHRGTVMAGGHTHTQMFRRFGSGILMNPGSVGMPIEHSVKGASDRRPPWSEYAILTSDKDKLGIAFRRVPLDVEAVIAQARKSGMPHAEDWIAPWC